MGLINYEQLEDGFDASANLWNERFGILFNEINGNLDAANLKNASITTPKIAPGAVTSDKLGFEKYIDDNGWLITDLGLVKLATKVRTFNTVAGLPVGGASFVTFDAGMNSNPVGFDENSAYNMNWAFSGSGDVGRYNFLVESAGNPKPNTAVVQSQLAPQIATRQIKMHVWVVF